MLHYHLRIRSPRPSAARGALDQGHNDLSVFELPRVQHAPERVRHVQAGMEKAYRFRAESEHAAARNRERNTGVKRS